MGRGDLLQIVSEPEAAATYALDAMNPHVIKVGDTFVLCDAGGGTVDLISYCVWTCSVTEGRRSGRRDGRPLWKHLSQSYLRTISHRKVRPE